jgi:hypothetical protein
MGEVIVTDSDRIGLDSRRHVEIGIGNHFGLAARVN